MNSTTQKPKTAVPLGVWVLGFVSLFMDMSSELVHALLPVYMATTLGASALTIGLLEGTAEAMVLITKVFSGYISDAFGKRKPLVLFGYGLAAAVKPLFPLANGVGLIVTARLLDRFGKGIRGAPRDALIADITDQSNRGAAFGLRQSLDTVGAVIGPLIAVVLLTWVVDDIRTVLWVAVIPAVICVLLLAFGLREPNDAPAKPSRLPITREGLRQLGRPFWIVTMVAGLLSLARFSEAFLVLRGNEQGMSTAQIPLIMVVMALVYSFSAYPVGVMADRMSRRALLAAGMLMLVLADVILAKADNALMVFAAAAAWGLHMGMTQGLLSAMIADTTPAAFRGTGFGVYSLVSGCALLVSSALAGLLWDRLGADVTFTVGAGFALLTVVATLLVPRTARG